MKVVILAGGLGTRLGEMTRKIPKPMVPVGGKPIIWHIMNLYAHYGHKDFYLALGYKANELIKYTKKLSKKHPDWKINAVDTGLKTLTGGRAKQISKLIGNEACFLTYGDGVSNINLDKLLKFHKRNKKLATVSAVRPVARFGELHLKGNAVVSFKEKPQMQKGWINGGFFILEPGFFKLIQNNKIMLEREPIEKATQLGELVAYKHYGFWQCMDSPRDRAILENLYSKKNTPWIDL